MKNHPFSPFELRTNLSVSEVLDLLKKHVDKKHLFNNIRSNKSFEGVLFPDGFDIRRIPSGMNSFIPNLIGSFKKNGKGVDVIVRISPNKIILSFLGSIFLILSFFELALLLVGKFSLNGFIIPLFILIITPTGYHFERKRAKDLLEKILLK